MTSAEEIYERKAYIGSDKLYDFVEKRGGVLLISIQDYLVG